MPFFGDKALKISIHAPAKGATGRRVLPPLNRSISIHAPAKGATFSDPRWNQGESNFNPRSREGSDYADGMDRFNQLTISIHAPAKGATTPIHCSISSPCIFQSTLPRRERRPMMCFINNYLLISIHAPAKGATPWQHLSKPALPNFNPRSREGSDYAPP